MLRPLIAIVSGNLKLRRYLKTCRLEDAPASGKEKAVFSFQGKQYDREKFIELVRRDFEKLSVRDRIGEAKVLTEGLEQSSNKELDLAYIEAYRRTLEGVLHQKEQQR